MIVLEDYVRRPSAAFSVERVPTCSSHATLARRFINEILKDDPQYYGFIRAMADYPIQRWAYESRKKTGLDICSIKRAAALEDGSFFGMKSEKWLKSQERKLELSDEIMEFVMRTISSSGSDAIKAVHGYRCRDVSNYIMQNCYRQDLLRLCESRAAVFDSLYGKISRQISLLDDDVQFVAHDASWFMKLKPLIERNGSERGDVDCRKAAERFNDCLNCLDSYYLKDPLMKEVARLYSKGKKETEICRITGRSRSYVRHTKAESVRAISCIIWGYCSLKED